jgi:hypothetical protein
VWWHLAVCGLICHQKGAALLSTFHWFSSGWRRGIDFRAKDFIDLPTGLLALQHKTLQPSLTCRVKKRRNDHSAMKIASMIDRIESL